MSDRLLTTEGVTPGTIVMVSVELTDRTTGAPFWWRRFAAVDSVVNIRFARLVTMKLHHDPDKDVRDVDFTKDVVVPVLEHQMPPGIAAIHVKMLHKGLIPAGS